jgi:hypothetical protein
VEDNFSNLVTYLLPEGILEYFVLTSISNDSEGLKIRLEERNLPPMGYSSSELESKGFYDEISIQDFPIRNRKAFLCIKRRRWTVLSTGDVISRDWQLVQKGTRMTKEFAAFLKGILR